MVVAKCSTPQNLRFVAVVPEFLDELGQVGHFDKRLLTYPSACVLFHRRLWWAAMPVIAFFIFPYPLPVLALGASLRRRKRHTRAIPCHHSRQSACRYSACQKQSAPAVRFNCAS